jgi:hypothetical protein
MAQNDQKIEELEKRISVIEARDKRKALDKGWETSWARRLVIASLTYLIVVLYLHWLKANDPWLNGLVPVAGYLLSTLALPYLKNWWIKNKSI